jgi:hypothetical protein
MKIKKLATCVSLYEDVFNPEDAEYFLQKLEEDIKDEWNDLTWSNSGVGNQGTVTDYRTSLSCSLIPLMKPYPPTELSEFFNLNIREHVDAVVEDYRNENMLPNAFQEPFGVLKYLPESEYHAHYDHFRDNARVFSMVGTLKEPEEGGELEFPTIGLTVPPRVGSVILFPSNFPYIHIAHPVSKGIKFSMVTWYS